ncbi:hypothetical protein J7E62_02330 [Variovorax paradoxus]|nr:hypothetical protein [Variovorax paradoxus]
MKSTVLTLSVLLACFTGPAGAEPWGFLRVSDPRRNEVRDAVEAHRAAKREEVRRQEAAAGRRLTAAELAELRQQVRQQSIPRQDIVHSAESQPAERMTPMASPNVRVAPRSQRP